MPDDLYAQLVIEIMALDAKPGVPLAAPALDSLARTAGIALPGSVRDWLLRVNGVALPCADLFGMGEGYRAGDIIRTYDRIPRYRAEQLLPVGGDGCGNHHVLDLRLGAEPPVLFTESFEDWQPIYIMASDFQHYLSGVFRRSKGTSKWPFDQEDATRNDPAIFNASYTLPWKTN